MKSQLLASAQTRLGDLDTDIGHITKSETASMITMHPRWSWRSPRQSFYHVIFNPTFILNELLVKSVSTKTTYSSVRLSGVFLNV
jgi:hypothetical protein